MEQRVCKKTTIGGQALLEGILMKGPKVTAICIRKPDGELDLTTQPTDSIAEEHSLFKLPFFRGMAGLYDAMKLGFGALDYSASFYEEEEEEDPGFIEKHFGRKTAEAVSNFMMYAVVIVLFVGIFLFLPTWISNFFRKWVDSVIALNLIEGLVRILLFLAYVILISLIPDLKRVFMYHGAEHKTIACYEGGEELTVENVRKYSRLHPRCGTSFLANIVIFSALFLSLFGWPNPVARVLIRLAMIPVLIGIIYELNRWTGRSESLLSRILRWPGLFVQRVATVKEPDDSMIEVAICAMKEVIPENPEDDVWK